MKTRRHKHERITRINSRVGRDINRSIILNAVRRHQPISRAEISELSHLNKSTVSVIVADLIEEDLLVQNPDQGGAVGRNRMNLSIKQGKHFVGAIALDAPYTRVAVVDLDGSVKAREEIQTTAAPPQQIVAQCLARLQALRAMLGPHHFHGVGMSVAGIVDSTQSTVLLSANLGWTNVDVGSIFATQASGIEWMGIENDAKASALAELLLGKRRFKSTNLIFIFIGAGIGAGVVINNRILSGNAHAAGEIGHMTLVDGGAMCPCGNTGCWELYVSQRAPIAAFAAAKGPSVSQSQSYAIDEVLSAARSGDKHALEAVRQWAQHIGAGIGNLICVLDPEIITVSGPITRVWDLVEADINESAHGHGMYARSASAMIAPTSLADSPPLLGAAALCIRRIFADYSITM